MPLEKSICIPEFSHGGLFRTGGFVKPAVRMSLNTKLAGSSATQNMTDKGPEPAVF
jgi:hypothetical protein